MTFVKFRKALAVGLVFAGACLPAMIAPASAQKNELDIDLKLFRTQDLPANPTGCHFALWQSNRDPATDKYSYLFFQPFSEDGAPLPARMRIGKEFIDLHEIAQSQEDAVGGLLRHHVYRSSNPTYRVLIEIRKADGAQTMAPISDASIYVVTSDKLPFPARAKGQYGCPDIPEDSAGADAAQESETATASGWSGPSGIPFGREQVLGSYSEVPREVKQQVTDYAGDDCYIDGTPPWPGSRYVINEYYLLWQVPCFVAAYQGASAFAVTQNPPQGWANLLSLPNPPGLDGHENYAAMNAEVLNDKGIIRITEKGRGMGDCGIHQVFRLTDGPGEVLELELMEYREKTECDGVANAPASWPLAYRSY